MLSYTWGGFFYKVDGILSENIVKTKLLLVRHGETESNVIGRIQGQTDTPLTPRGRHQAMMAGKHLQRITLGGLYCSDLGRARDTANIIGCYLGRRASEDSRFREINFGEAEGSTWSEMTTRFPDIAARWRNHSKDAKYPGGESRSEAMQRVKAGFMAIHESHPGQVVAIVTHGGVLATVFAWVLGIPEGVRPRCKVLNASINTVAIHQDSAQIVSWGDVAHLWGQ